MRIIDEVGFDDSTFLFNNSRSFNCNVRPACLLNPPPLGKYPNCPAVTDLEGEVCATLHNIALLALHLRESTACFYHLQERVVALSIRRSMIFE
jgi:hypothetical protein